MGSTNLPPDLPVEDTSASNILRSGVVRSHIKDLLSVPPETSDFSSAAKELATSDGVIWTSVDPETV
ncbi:hypothetical protein H6768_04850 [Candidatus Peribacteria bacterium]|nr:hypothetical protein [Candidatus Peribacteria bacterium]